MHHTLLERVDPVARHAKGLETPRASIAQGRSPPRAGVPARAGGEVCGDPCPCHYLGGGSPRGSRGRLAGPHPAPPVPAEPAGRWRAARPRRGDGRRVDRRRACLPGAQPSRKPRAGPSERPRAPVSRIRSEPSSRPARSAAAAAARQPTSVTVSLAALDRRRSSRRALRSRDAITERKRVDAHGLGDIEAAPAPPLEPGRSGPSAARPTRLRACRPSRRAPRRDAARSRRGGGQRRRRGPAPWPPPPASDRERPSPTHAGREAPAPPPPCETASRRLGSRSRSGRTRGSRHQSDGRATAPPRAPARCPSVSRASLQASGRSRSRRVARRACRDASGRPGRRERAGARLRREAQRPLEVAVEAEPAPRSREQKRGSPSISASISARRSWLEQSSLTTQTQLRSVWSRNESSWPSSSSGSGL